MGTKGFVLADATKGYMQRHHVYDGKKCELTTHEQGLSIRVVLELLQGIEHVHHKVYMDNYYTSFHPLRQEGGGSWWDYTNEMEILPQGDSSC